jgi:hypothetical protein
MTLRIVLVTLLGAAGLATVGGDRLIACGDKYLNLGLGTHYRRTAAERRSAAVLIYANPGTELARVVTTLTVEPAMKKAGYQPAIANSSAALDASIASRTWDVVIVDGRDAASVIPRLPTGTTPHVVPVLSKLTKDELKAAQRTYETVITNPSKSTVFVSVVDDAMDLHALEMEAASKAARKATR